MALINKTSLSPDLSGIVSNGIADPGDVTVPMNQLRDYNRAGRVAALDSSTQIGTLDDVLLAGSGIQKSSAGDAVTLSVDLSNATVGDAVTIESTSGNAALTIDAANGTFDEAQLNWQQAGVTQWQITTFQGAGDNLRFNNAAGDPALHLQQSNLAALFYGDVAIDDALGNGSLRVDGDLNHDGSNVGFFGVTPTTRPIVMGSRGGNAALANLLTGLTNLGLIVNGTTT